MPFYDRSEFEILIVEDSHTQAEQLAMILEGRGYSARVAPDGERALEMMRERPPSLVVSDIVMPKLDGYGMCLAAKQDSDLKDIPVILVTTLSDPGDVLRGLECGADNFIRKPVDERYLLSRIDYLLMNRALRREQRTQMGLEIDLRGQRYFINSDRQQMLDLLISTYEQAVDLNLELTRRERELADSNEALHALYRVADGLNRSVSVDAIVECVLDGVMDLPNVQGVAMAMAAVGGALQTLGTRGELDEAAASEILLPLPNSGREASLRIQFDEADDAQKRVLASIGNQLRIALERAELYEDLEQLAARRTQELADLNRLYSMLSGINNSIVRCQSREELFKEACRVATQEGELPLAWIASTQADDTVAADIVYACGDPDRASQAVLAVALADLNERGLIERAYDSGMPLVLSETDEVAVGVGRGYRSMAILPLVLNGQHAGVCVLYAEHPKAFSHDKELALLKEIAGDISFALDYQDKAKRVNYLAYYDSLTGLPNRSLFADRCQQALVDAGRHGRSVAVAILDLDRFKTINDSLGHSVGDAFLDAVAARFQATIRDRDTVARLAGDEFAFNIADISGEETAGHVIGKIMACFDEPFMAAGHELFTSASIGVSMFPGDGRESDELMRNADAAMYRAKAAGRNTYQFYSADMTAKARERLALENALRRALENDEFLVHYQPVIDLVTGRVTGTEALVRWQHPERGLVPPFHFIPIAEETSLIVDLGAWVMEEACRQAAGGWSSAPDDLSVAVNVSTRQFLHGDFCGTVTDVLERTGLDPARLTLEITESHLMDSLDRTVTIMKELGALGIRFSVDDFGTGYSSLAYLKDLQIENLKVDRSFIKNLPENADSASITEAIILMAHSLKQRVIAEGVETEEQLTFLRERGCDAVQGYLFSKPLPPDELDVWFTEGLPGTKASDA